MRNFVSKIFAGIASARLFSMPPRNSALARERLASHAPFLLLLAALAAAVFSWIANGGFNTVQDTHDGHSLTLAANLSLEHRFLMFLRQDTGVDGELFYDFYNRFPIGIYLLIKAVIVPFGDSTSAQIFAARLLIAAFFSGAAAFAYFGLRRLTNQPWIALAATLAAFSSYYALFYGDMIAPDMPGIFGVMLTFHGMMIFVQEGRFRQLLVKALASVLLNWTVMALLLPFTALGLAYAISHAVRERPSSPFADKARAAFAAFVSSRHLWLGAAALLFCALVMGFGIANEYIALRGEVPLLDLPSVQSMLWRANIDETTLAEYPGVAWLPLIELQFERIGGVSLPYFILPWLGLDGFWVGAAASAAGLIGLAFTRYKLVTMALLLTGWIWALALRGSSIFHEGESLYHIGVPLAVFSILLTTISRRSKWNAIGAAATVAALIAFGISILQFGRFAYSEDLSVTAANFDLDAIRKITNGASVCVGPMGHAWGMHHGITYYLAGSDISSGIDPCATGKAAGDSFIIEPARAESDALLTPQNRLAFLYDAQRLNEPPHETALKGLSSREPVIRSNFSVYFDEGKLIYAKTPCSDLDIRGRFFIHVRPVDNGDLPPSATRSGFEDVAFLFYKRGARFDDVCLARVILPDYPIERVRVGQFDEDGGIWSAFFVLDDAAYRSASAEAALAAPAAQGYFDLYLQENRLLFLREPCDPSDAQARFLLYVYPANDAGSLRNFAQRGFDNLDFNFDERGAIFDGKCAAIADLPSYPIERIRFGQFNEDGGIWSAFFVLDDAAYRAASGEAALAAPAAQGYFDLYLQEGRLLFLREPCDPSDGNVRFFLHLHPVDNADLPQERKEFGFDNLDFRFDERGALFDGKCAAIADLPAYPIERIRFGQSDDEGVIWSAFFVLDDAPYRLAFAEAARSEPTARNYFDLYLQGDMLLFLREPCEPSDANARFFLHLHPVDGGDLPQGRRQYGFDNLDFRFDERGALFDGKCAAIVNLPAYPIERIRFGQSNDEGVIWSAAFVPNDVPYRLAFAEAARSEPAARNYFDLYLQGDRLLFLREPCKPSDANARFFLHLHPVDGGDLPQDRRQYGFDNLDFRFDERGALFDGKCAAIADLPAYPIERIRAGQINGEGEIWEASIARGERG